MLRKISCLLSTTTTTSISSSPSPSMCRTPPPPSPTGSFVWSSDDDDNPPAIPPATTNQRSTPQARKRNNNHDVEICSETAYISLANVADSKFDDSVPLREDKIVIFTSDEESGDDHVRGASSPSPPPLPPPPHQEEETRRRRAPPSRRRNKDALSSDSSDSSGDDDDVYLSAVSTRRAREDTVIVITDDDDTGGGPPALRSTRPVQRRSKASHSSRVEKALVDLFVKTSISDNTVALSTSDDDSSSPADVPARRPRPRRWADKKPPNSTYIRDENFPASDDGLSKTATTCPDLVEPLQSALKTPGRRADRFRSPEKQAARIPPTPHHPESAEFWDPVVTNKWNDQHSPRKVPLGPLTNLGRPIISIHSESESEESDTAYDSMDDFIEDDDDGYGGIRRVPKPKALKTPAKTPRTTTFDRQSKREWDARKTALAQSFVQLMDSELTDGGVTKYYGNRGGIKLDWNSKLLKTAGRAKLVKGTIELSNKVITDEHRLYNTLAHEYCHLAVWAISQEKRDVHGPVFKEWGARVSAKFSEYNIKVTTLHSYEIEYKFEFHCQTPHCTYSWSRHSKPKDLDRKRCPWCRVGLLVQVKPPLRPARPPTDYQLFTKAHMARIKQENPQSPHKEVMSILGQEWKKHKAQAPRKGYVDLDEMPDTTTAARAKARARADIDAVVAEDRCRYTGLDGLMSELKVREYVPPDLWLQRLTGYSFTTFEGGGCSA